MATYVTVDLTSTLTVLLFTVIGFLLANRHISLKLEKLQVVQAEVEAAEQRAAEAQRDDRALHELILNLQVGIETLHEAIAEMNRALALRQHFSCDETECEVSSEKKQRCPSVRQVERPSLSCRKTDSGSNTSKQAKCAASSKDADSQSPQSRPLIRTQVTSGERANVAKGKVDHGRNSIRTALTNLSAKTSFRLKVRNSKEREEGRRTSSYHL